MSLLASGPRLLRVRCSRWDQVESFLRKKLRADGRLSMKVPFDAEPGSPITLTLELPNQIVIALEGTVARAEAGERADATVVQLAGAKYAIDRLEAMLADARAGGEGGDLAATLSVREAELRRLRQQAAHEVLGISRTPTLEELRRAWRLRARREHPDAVARLGSAALRLTAEEAMIHVTRAYERLRDTVVSDKRAVIAGTSVRTLGSIALEVAPSDSFEVEPLTPPVEDAAIPAPRSNPALAVPPPPTSSPALAVPPPPVDLPQLLDTDAITLDGFDKPMSQPLALDLDLPPPTDAPPPPRRPRASSTPPTTNAMTTAASPRPLAARTPTPSTPAPPPARPITLPPPSVGAPAPPSPARTAPTSPPPPPRAAATAPPPSALTSPSSLDAMTLSPLPKPAPAGPAPATVEQSLRIARSGPGDRFVRAVHDRLALADHAGAAQIAAAAHQVYPQDVRLSALIEIAAAQAACARGDRAAAVRALEAAIALDPEGAEARLALTLIGGGEHVEPSMIQDRYR